MAAFFPAVLRRSSQDVGLVWTIMVSALVHAAVVGALLVTPQRFLGAPPPLESYTVELVAQDVIGGTNLVPGAGGAEEPAAVAAPAPPVPSAASASARRQEDAQELQADQPKEQEARPERERQTAKQEAPQVKEAPAPKPPVKAVAPPEPKPEAKPEPKPEPAAAEARKAAAPKQEKVKKQRPAEVSQARSPDERIAAAIKRRVARVQPETGLEGAAAAGEKTMDQRIAAAVRRRVGPLSGSGLRDDKEGQGGPVAYGPGSGVGGVVKGAQYILYRNQMEARIKAAWAWTGADESLRAVIHFNITPAGKIINVRTIKSSGDPSYDASAERAVRAADSLPPPPEKYVDAFSIVELTFRPEDRGT